jgi:hypothetical protein
MSEIAPIIGSLAQLDVSSLVHAGVLGPLFDSLQSSEFRVIESSAKALRAIVQNPLILKECEITQTYLHNLVSLSKTPESVSNKASIHISEVSISILARLTDDSTVREWLCQTGGVTILTEWLNETWIQFPRVQESALDCLSSLCKGNKTVASAVSLYNGINRFYLVSSGKSVSAVLFQLLHDRRPLMRLGSCICLVNLFLSGALTADYEPMITTQLLTALIRLFDDTTLISWQLGMSITSIQERSIAHFAILIQDNPKLQTSSLEGDAISKLARILTALNPTESGDVSSYIQESVPNSDHLCTSVLLAIAAASSLTEECRKQVIEMKILPCIVSSLENANVGIRAAACKCARSLSRSVKHLRTSLMDAGIALPIFQLLFDEDINVQITASATLCNIVLDFSPMKKIVIEKGGVQQLVQLVHSSNQELRLNAAWALKNMLFHTDLETKKSVMQHLGWNTLSSIINDHDVSIQVQALNLWRNLACAKVSDIDFVFDGLGKDVILNILEDKLINKNQYPSILLQVIIL